MKTTLTIEQSAELIKRGVTLNENDSEVFDIGELLSLLPKKITLDSGLNACLNIFMADEDYCVTSYTLNNNASIISIGPCEPVDSLYRALLWAIDHNHVKLD